MSGILLGCNQCGNEVLYRSDIRFGFAADIESKLSEFYSEKNYRKLQIFAEQLKQNHLNSAYELLSVRIVRYGKLGMRFEFTLGMIFS